MHHRDPRKNSSQSLLREPFGRPLGLPDWPGFQGINPRCLCFRTVESLPAASAIDIVQSNPLRGSFECITERVRATSSHHGPQADELWMVCFYTELRGRAPKGILEQIGPLGNLTCP